MQTTEAEREALEKRLTRSGGIGWIDGVKWGPGLIGLLADAKRGAELEVENAQLTECLRVNFEGLRQDELWGSCPESHAPGIDDCTDRDCHLDPGIYEIVWGLHEAGVQVGTSCQGGGSPHASMTRLVRLYEGDGPAAYDMAKKLGMPVYALARVKVDERVEWWELWFGQEPWKRAALVEEHHA